jgi:hypothetical protein
MAKKEPNKLKNERDAVKQQLKALQEEGHMERNQFGYPSRKMLEYEYVHLLTPVGWGAYAKMLKVAADAVLAEFEKHFEDSQYLPLADIDSVYIYLIGMTIENLLKGIYLARNPIMLNKNHIENKKGGYKLPEQLGTHALGYFARNSDVDFSQDESELIELLEYFVKRLGKYLIPKTSDEYIEAEARFKFGLMPDSQHSPLNLKKFSKDVNKLYSKCQAIIWDDIYLWGEGIDY